MSRISFRVDFDGIDGAGYPWLAARARRKQAARCPEWCEARHEEPEPHWGDMYDFLVLVDGLNTGHNPAKELVQVGLDQLKRGGDTMIAVVTPHNTLWLSLQEARRLAVRLLQLDIDAAAGGAL